ncbi:PQQ-binding-like beta-propeller repeat protein [Streptomyces sp. NPDC002619]|uniref:outer membrane protein assembly factor BamB family protein n=1 Tax=Streptomyces sp. NPDC002619 TaxID=3364655 RepID=UPI003695DDFE
MAALRPKGWGLWERKPTVATRRDGDGDLPSCAGTGEVLVCTEVGVVAERVDVASGRVLWSQPYTGLSVQAGSVVGFIGDTVLIDDTRGDDQGKEGLIGFDVKTGDQLWSTRAVAPSFSLQESTVTTVTPPVHGNGRIDRRDARTGRLVVSRTFPADELCAVFGGDDGALYLLKYGEEGFITSVAVLDAATMRTTKVLATFDEDPGKPLTADSNTVSFLRDGQSVTRVTRADGSTERPPLRGAPEGPARVQGNTLYLSRADGALASYDLRTGQRNWSVETGGESPARPVLAGGRLYSLASDGRITCLDATTGETVWRSATRRDPNTSVATYHSLHPEPAVLHGVVYAGSTTGSIFAVTPPTA